MNWIDVTTRVFGAIAAISLLIVFVEYTRNWLRMLKEAQAHFREMQRRHDEMWANVEKRNRRARDDN